jgi:hypothetical protein
LISIRFVSISFRTLKVPILSSSQSEYLGFLGKYMYLYRLRWLLNVRIWKNNNKILNNLLQSITSNNYWIPHKVLLIVHSKEKILFNKQLCIAQNNKTATSQLGTLLRQV